MRHINPVLGAPLPTVLATEGRFELLDKMGDSRVARGK
jgi:hypothetical protein